MNQEGQAFTEYVLLMSIVIGFYFMVTQALTHSGLAQKIAGLVMGPFSAAYRYGHPKAKGYDEGTPENHPRIDDNQNNNFRIFLDPVTQ